MQALERILAILDSVCSSPTGVPAARVAAETGLSLSTVVRLMQSLQDEDVLLRSELSGQYRIGPRLIGIVGSATQSFEVRAAAMPILEKLRDVSKGETASLHVRQGTQRVCVAAAYTSHASGRIVPIGLPLPLPGSAVGHVLLSQLAADERDTVLRGLGLASDALDELVARVQTVARDGYASSVNDSVEGIRGLAVPLSIDHGGGALSVSGPTDRFTEDLVPAVLEGLQEAAASFSRARLNVSGVLSG